MRKIAYVFLLMFVFFAAGCGLENVPSIDAPVSGRNKPSWDTRDNTLRFFSFVAGGGSSPDVTMLGTAVYYKIYNNYSTMISVNASIDSLNSSSSSAAAAQSIISRGYKQLGLNGSEPSPLISGDSSRAVEIRLTNYQETTNPAWRAYVNVNGSFVGSPTRVPSGKSFDFGRPGANSTLDKLPLPSDSDVNLGSFSEANVYYVDAYAVNVGYDATFANQYSKVLHLGAIRIESDKTDN